MSTLNLILAQHSNNNKMARIRFGLLGFALMKCPVCWVERKYLWLSFGSRSMLPVFLVWIVMKAAGQNSKRRITLCSNNKRNSEIKPSHRVGKQFIHNSCERFLYEKVPRLKTLRRQFSDNSTWTKMRLYMFPFKARRRSRHLWTVKLLTYHLLWYMSFSVTSEGSPVCNVDKFNNTNNSPSNLEIFSNQTITSSHSNILSRENV